MRDKDDEDKKRRKKLVNVISSLARKRLNESSENGVVEDEENVPTANANVDVIEELPLSARRSKRKPEKTSKVTSERHTVESSDNEEGDIVKSSSSEDEFEDSPEEVDNQTAKQQSQANANNSKENIDMPLRMVKCTACNESIHTKRGRFCRHPDLNTIICKDCYKFYSSGKFTKDEYGVEEFCRWCADGGQLVCCDFCEKAFCKKCIKRNLGRSKSEELLNADESEEWNCFCCDPTPISALVELCDKAMHMLDNKRDQTNTYKDRKGRKFIHGPSISERRNILTTFSPKNLVSSEVNSTLSESEEKDSNNFDKDISPSKEAINTKKEQSDDIAVKRELEDDGNRTIVLTVESSEDDFLNSDQDVKNAEAKTIDKSYDENSETDSDGPPKIRGKKKKKLDNHADSSSSEEELSRSKKKNRSKKGKKSKSGRKRLDSESPEDPVSSRDRKIRKHNRRARISSDEGTDEDEATESGETDTSEASVERKKTRGKKRKRQLSRSTDTESESNNVSSRKKLVKKKKIKGKTKRKWRLRGKHGESSCSDFDFEDGGKKKSKSKKKNKFKRRRKSDTNDDDESDEETASPSKKGRRKIRKILDNEKLAEATRHARQLEEERRQRLLEKTKNTEFKKPQTFLIKELVLEYKPDGKTPLVEVQQDLIEHLKPHQVKGVKFMYDCTIESVERWKKKEEGGGCILAHVMGLGKTLQVVALVHTLYRNDLIQLRRVLVVCPLNTVLNWQVEFEKWLSVDDRLDVFVLNEVRSGNWERADMLNNWMKHGGILIMGYHMYRNLSQCVRIKNKHQKKIYEESLVDPGPELVVCDEGHILRNCKSAISISMNKIKTKRRIVLTGTPLQNNLVEYHCMASFVKPNLLGTLKEFSNSFIRPIENGQCADSTVVDVKLMKRRCHVLHKMLQGCVQRKDYCEIEKFLPPKFEYVIKVRLAEKQREMYKYYLDTFLSTEEGIKGRGGSLFSDYQVLMRIWTHPWSLKLETELRKIENFVDTDTDGSLKDFIDDCNEDESAMSNEQMSWTSDNNSSDDNSEESEEEKSRKSSSEENEENNVKEETTPSKSKRRAEKQSDRKEKDKKIKTEPGEPSTSKVCLVDNDDDVVEIKPAVNEKADSGKKNMVSSTLRSGLEFKEATEMSEMQAEGEEAEWYDQFLIEEDETNVELGSKIVLLLEILADAAALEEKVIVFSHSLISLDVIEMALGGGEIGGNTEDWCRGCDYFRMDGSTTVQMRKRWADIFNDEENKAARLFLISTRAGGLGINMVGASRVIVFDVSWNPSHDVQSIFRAYRFGQNKPVFVYRFIAQGTMEEKIYDRQVTKLSMSQRVVDERQIQRHFNATDLAELYRFEPDVLKNENEERPTPAVPKDAVLAELINRLYPKWIVKYHEHDSLLQNRPEEELTEAERKEAWDQWELEKQGILNPPQPRAEHIPQMVNGTNIRPNIVFIDTTGRNPSAQPPFRFPAPPPENAPTLGGGQRYQQMVLEEQRRRLFEMDKRRREEQQRLARDSLLRLQQQEQHRRRLIEEQKRAEEEKKRGEQQMRQQTEQQRLREQEQRLREQQQRLREQQQREQQRLRAQQLQQEQKRRQEQQQQQMGQQFLQQLLRNRNAYVTRQTQPGRSNQSVFQVVVDDNANSNPTTRSQRSPPRIVELPPDA